MVRWKSKGCPKCGGTTFFDKDEDGWYEQCMMCSHRVDRGTIAEFGEKNAQSNDEVTSTRNLFLSPREALRMCLEFSAIH